MKRNVAIFLTTFFSLLSATASQLVWSGGERSVISVVPPAASGLDEVCVVSGVDGRRVGLQASSASAVKWYLYSTLGGGYAEEISDVEFADGVSSPRKLEPDMGYIAEWGDERYSFWVVDYSLHPFSVTAITEGAEKDCSFTQLDVSGTGSEMAYYGINGRHFTLDRDIRLTYRTLVADSEDMSFVESVITESFPYLQSSLRVAAPLCPTEFEVDGDRFLREWGDDVKYVSEVVAPYAVQSLTSAEQNQRDVDNEVSSDAGASGFGGSAPCTVSFEAVVTDAAMFKEWQLSHFEDFEDVNLRFQELSFDYTFTEEGVTYVRFMCANADGSCEAYGDVYTISIGASSLKCPNAFSPNGDGVNDEWKVSYSSIVSFDCHIFDRYGHEMTSFSDPASGWDGRYKGKLVPTGAYYYVIKARGADGKNYKLSGDINIVNYEQ